jgi:hypothetical protein
MLRVTMVITDPQCQKPTYATLCTTSAEGSSLILKAKLNFDHLSTKAFA